MAKTNLIKASSYKEAKMIFRAIDNPKRLEILNILEKETECSVSFLCEKTGMLFQVASLHLRVLKKNNLVICEVGSDGRNRLYRLNKERIAFVNNAADDLVSKMAKK